MRMPLLCLDVLMLCLRLDQAMRPLDAERMLAWKPVSLKSPVFQLRHKLAKCDWALLV